MEPSADNLLTLSNVILDSLSDGVYVCDKQRRIVYWSKSAERITGWTAAEVVGRPCFDNVLCHVDKDGHRLCGEEFCPLHRSMVTGTTSDVPLIVFAQAKDGRRIPTQVSVAPIRDADGAVVGGVEAFRDVSAALADLQRAQRIQTLSLEHDLPADPRIRFSTSYAPRDIVGGDYFAIQQLDPDRYGFLLADAMGHGVAAALNTMYLSSLWGRLHKLLARPAEFAAALNSELAKVVKDESFATAMCGVVDVARREVLLSGGGNPPALLVRPTGEFEQIECAGLPLGVVADVSYDETKIEFLPGDRLLLFSDGAVEIHDAENMLLGVDGLITILRRQGYPAADIRVAAIDEELLKYSNAIRLEDDFTLIEVRFNE